MTGKHLGEIYTELAYVRGSLRNLGDQSGWTFTLANPPIPLAGVAEELFLVLDGQRVDSEKVWIRTGQRVRRASSVCRTDLLPFAVGQEAVFSVQGEPLRPGEHTVTIAIMPLGFGEIYTTFSFSDTPAEPEPVLVSRERFGDSVALTNGRAFLVANRAGDLSAQWNWFGAENDNGGLYLPPARFLRSLRFSVEAEGSEVSLADSVVEARLLPGRLTARAVPFPEVRVCRTVFVPRRHTAAVTRFSLHNEGAESVSLRLCADFEAALVPYGLLGVKVRSGKVSLTAEGVADCATPEVPYRVGLGASVPPESFAASGMAGRLIYQLTIPAGEVRTLEFAVAGTVDGSDPCPAVVECCQHAAALEEETAAALRGALTATYSLRTPDPVLNKAWDFARLGLWQLCFRHPEIGAGICAGLPRFPNYWSRDSAWAGMGLLAAGETGFVREALENFFTHQLEEDQPEAQAGDLPTVISGSAFMHLLGWGTSADGPGLILILLAAYVRQSGDVAFAHRHYGAVRRLLEWARRQDLDGDGFLEHGVANGTTTSHALAIPDTTWMDHIDRRKSGCEVQGIYWQALRSAADLAGWLGHDEDATVWRREADELESRFWQVFYPPEVSHPYDRIRLDGRLDPALRPNFAVNLLFNTQLAPERAVQALAELDVPAIRAPHGIRTLAVGEERYDPISYHHGCVWPLVTGWVAMAALFYGKMEQGYDLVRTLAENLVEGFGHAAELYRGDRREAYNGCFQQAWSLSVLLQAVGSYLLGLRPDALARRLEMAPRLPAGWDQVAVAGVTVGGAVLDLVLRPNGVEAVNRGAEAATLSWQGHEVQVKPGETAAIAV